MRHRTKTIEIIKQRCAIEPPPSDPLARAVSGDCWTWTGATARAGYGVVRHDGVLESTHRLTLVLTGVDPGDGHVDHLCRNVRCCNPEHLDPVPVRENVRRGRLGVALGSGACGKCGSLDGYVHTRGNGRVTWVCRPCRKQRVKKAMDAGRIGARANGGKR